MDRRRKEARDGERDESEKPGIISHAVQYIDYKAESRSGPAVPGQRQGPHLPFEQRRPTVDSRPGSELAGYADHEAVVDKKGSLIPGVWKVLERHRLLLCKHGTNSSLISTTETGQAERPRRNLTLYGRNATGTSHSTFFSAAVHLGDTPQVACAGRRTGRHAEQRPRHAFTHNSTSQKGGKKLAHDA
ncbi:hypothetical protein TgHK011_001761 [Trichoderma gracile]|nr:hypothetical protein TgHK011_001761 [Trichoderma gracile]